MVSLPVVILKSPPQLPTVALLQRKLGLSAIDETVLMSALRVWLDRVDLWTPVSACGPLTVMGQVPLPMLNGHWKSASNTSVLCFGMRVQGPRYAYAMIV